MGRIQLVIGALLAALGWASLTVKPVHALAMQGAAALPGSDGGVSSLAAGLGFGGVIGGALLALFGVIGMVASLVGKAASEVKEDPKAAQRQLEAFHELLAGAVGRMAAVDGDVSAAELGMVSGVIEKFGGIRIDAPTIKRLSQGGEGANERFMADLKQRGAQLTDVQKEHIVRASLLVAMSDLQFQEAESTFLNSTAAALGLSEMKLAEIRSSVTDVAQKLVGAAAFAA